MIEVESLTKRFGAKTAIEDVSFSARRGEVLGFLGPNGAGKTTTLRILAGLIPPTSGRARIDGHDTMRDGLAARRRLGYMPERVPLYDEMRTGDFLRFAAAMKGIAARDRAAAVARAADETHVSSVLRDPIARLSRGYRQRVGLAQALLGDPPVLLLDEPTAGLDPRQIAETRALILRLAGDRTILLSTHILPEVSAICGRVIILSRGRVVAVDTPSALAARAAGARRIEIAVDGAGAHVESILLAVPGVLSAQRIAAGRFAATTSLASDLRPEITAALVARGERLLEIKNAGPSLEEIFLDLVLEEEGGAGA